MEYHTLGISVPKILRHQLSASDASQTDAQYAVLQCFPCILGWGCSFYVFVISVLEVLQKANQR